MIKLILARTVPSLLKCPMQTERRGETGALARSRRGVLTPYLKDLD
jgi:hypothetical protein